MIISFGECSVPVSGLYLYFALPNWSILLAITDAPPTLAVACAPPLRLIAYASLAFLYTFWFFRTCAERPRRRRPLGGKTTLCFICVDPCRTRFHVRRSMAIAVYAPPKRASFTCAARWRSPCMRRRSVRLVRRRSRRVCAATLWTCASAPPRRALVRRHSVGGRYVRRHWGGRGCAAEAVASFVRRQSVRGCAAFCGRSSGTIVPLA